MTVHELTSKMSSTELTEWMAYFSVEPFGETRQDLRIASYSCLLANINRGKNKPPYKIDDFVLDFEPPKKQTPEEMKTILQGMM